MNPFGVPEISVVDIARRLAAGEQFLLLDVREPYELPYASLGDAATLVPMSELATLHLAALPEAALDKEAEIIVMCHHGSRSAQVAAWLRAQGWSNVWNLTGGIDAYAREVDRAVGLY